MHSHAGVEFKELFEALGVVLEAAADVDALEGFVVALVGGTLLHRAHAQRVRARRAAVLRVGDGDGGTGLGSLMRDLLKVFVVARQFAFDLLNAWQAGW